MEIVIESRSCKFILLKFKIMIDDAMDGYDLPRSSSVRFNSRPTRVVSLLNLIYIRLILRFLSRKP